MIKLSNRLSLIAELVPQGKSVCDVGTDHGYLPAALFKSGKFTSVTATDINIKPLENAKANLKAAGIDGVKLMLSDGLQNVDRSLADTVIIAGMGGEVISGIIERCRYANDGVTFILQPMTAADKLRDFLANNGFFVEREIALEENRKLYSVMVARFDGKVRTLTASQRRIGALLPDGGIADKYIKKQYNICKKCAESLCFNTEKAAEYEEYSAAAKEIEIILKGTED